MCFLKEKHNMLEMIIPTHYLETEVFVFKFI